MPIGSSVAPSFAGSEHFAWPVAVVVSPAAKPVVPHSGFPAGVDWPLVATIVTLADSFAGVDWPPVVSPVQPIAFAPYS